MRVAFAASALCLSVLALSFLTQAAQPAAAQPAAAQAAPAANAPITPAAGASNSAPPAADAAARHVKRTACLKEAKQKKLIGADKTAFLKTCIEAPQEPISASRQIPSDRP